MRILSITGLLIVVSSSLSCRPVSDSVMLENLQQHRVLLEQLVTMATHDRLSCAVPAFGKAECLSQTKLLQYQTLLTSVRVLGISPQWNHRCILFPAVKDWALLGIRSHARGYAYAISSPLVPSTKDTRSELGEKAIAFRRVSGAWYLYF